MTDEKGGNIWPFSLVSNLFQFVEGPIVALVYSCNSSTQERKEIGQKKYVARLRAWVFNRLT